MIRHYLHTAGFYPIQWIPTGVHKEPGATYVRPSIEGLLRVFVPEPDCNAAIELYAGSLFNGQLCYQGAVHSEQEFHHALSVGQQQLAGLKTTLHYAYANKRAA